jgi:hypothetical protein
MSNSVYDFVSASSMKAFWHKKRDFSNTTFDTVDWNAIQVASQKITRKRLHWLLKHTCGICGVNAVLCKWKLRADDKCPNCQQSETAQHICSVTAKEHGKYGRAPLHTLQDG